MGLSILEDKSKLPGETDLTEALGSIKPLWDELIQHVKDLCSPITEDWKHYGKNSGWTLKLLLKKRNLFFLYPNKEHFYVVFVFGEKAVEAVLTSTLPSEIIEALRQAPKYAEGRGCRVEVRTREDIENVKIMLSIKLKH